MFNEVIFNYAHDDIELKNTNNIQVIFTVFPASQP